VRIALFSETYLPQHNGVALILDRLVNHLSGLGHDVFIAAPEAGVEGTVNVPPRVELVRAPGVPLPRYPDLRIAAPFSRRVSEAVRRFRPDVVHVVTEYSLGLIGLRAARELGVPAVASFHTNIPRYLPYYGAGWASGLCWRYLQWFHNKAEVTYCPSEAVQAILRDRGFRHVRIWSRGVDLERFNPERHSPAVRQRHGPGDALHLLYVGRLTPEKDLPVLFEAYRRVAAARPERGIQLLLAGDGAYSPKAQAAAPDGVRFLGHLEGEHLGQAYASADVFVFPSRTETLGNVVLEAMASGLPVIGVAEGGVLENVRDGVNGLLCEPGDAEAFARGILSLVDRPDLLRRLAGNARGWAEERTWEWAFTPLIHGYEEMARR
jgi:glycosyltransferase involved in cell wall biosynthesis